ncbi:dephospho-CoA kinase [Solicola gregarius]|uniref:Dephospho-CoA kinase n=1 Tax=Solicola gregarius TaxID=2908642 RepID=A0AA46TI76_9ACTN|nr:dephospho-CoA kinase [Solicola gregarius]UYM05297.1 dephospho-CoA kinase [Solicola gregarius]
MTQVGLTGGIGSGKSEVSRMLAERGAVVIDADVLAREVVARGTGGLAAVVGEFGESVLTEAGDLDRAALGERVFADPGARARLEAIIHPRVRARAAEIAAAAGSDAIVVHDVPLLVETGQQGAFDVLVVVDVSTDVQIDRLRERRGMSEEEARARIAAQAGRTQRTGVADIVVDNTGSLADLEKRVDELWRSLARPAR